MPDQPDQPAPASAQPPTPAPSGESAPDSLPTQPTAPASEPTASPSAPPSAEAAPSDSKHSTLKRIGATAAIALAFIGFRVWNSQTAADRLEVGQCAVRVGDDEIKGVECSDPKAEFTILHIEKDTKESAADQVCAPYAETTVSYYEGTDDGSDGDLICLGEAK